jgi:hypothetical protein
MRKTGYLWLPIGAVLVPSLAGTYLHVESCRAEERARAEAEGRVRLIVRVAMMKFEQESACSALLRDGMSHEDCVGLDDEVRTRDGCDGCEYGFPHHLCPSAPPIPADPSTVKEGPYTPSEKDFQQPGWACLRLSWKEPMHCQVGYDVTEPLRLSRSSSGWVCAGAVEAKASLYLGGDLRVASQRVEIGANCNAKEGPMVWR